MADDFAELPVGPGHNQAPPDLKTGPELRQSLEVEHASLVSKTNEMLDMASAFAADHEAVEDDDTSGVLAGVIRQILSTAKATEQVRVGVKDPYLRAGSIIDSFFGRDMKVRLETAAASLNRMQTAYQRAKDERIRRAAEEAATKARAEEEARRREAERAEIDRRRAEREARRAGDEAEAAAARQRALEADQRAQEAREAEERARVAREAEQRTAGASAAELSRTRGDYAMASLRTTVRFRVTDIRKVPAEYLLVNEKVINALIRGKGGRRDIPGIEVYEDKESVNR